MVKGIWVDKDHLERIIEALNELKDRGALTEAVPEFYPDFNTVVYRADGMYAVVMDDGSGNRVCLNIPTATFWPWDPEVWTVASEAQQWDRPLTQQEQTLKHLQLQIENLAAVVGGSHSAGHQFSMNNGMARHQFEQMQIRLASRDPDLEIGLGLAAAQARAGRERR